MPEHPSVSPRRHAIRAIVMTAGAAYALMSLRPGRLAAQQKTAKANVSYQDHPNGQAHCEICAYYQPPVACQLVRGEVSPNGWCELFHLRTG